MEWVETTGKSIDDAKDQALDKLGVDEAEAEFEVLEEPRQGLFGRVRGEARVRARVRPKAPRAKEDGKRRRRTKSSDDAPKADKPARAKTPAKKAAPAATVDGDDDAESPGAEAPSTGRSDRNQGRRSGRDGGNRQRSGNDSARPAQEDSPVEEVTSTVESFLTGLTEAFGVDSPVTVALDDGQLLATIEGKHGLLLGPKAVTLDAIQELTRVTAQRSAPSSIRIKVDVGGYREARRQALVGFARTAAERALDEGVEVVLEPMNAADRKTVHDAINEIDGVVTRSAGAEPRRRVVVGPDPSSSATSPDKGEEEE